MLSMPWEDGSQHVGALQSENLLVSLCKGCIWAASQAEEVGREAALPCGLSSQKSEALASLLG